MEAVFKEIPRMLNREKERKKVYKKKLEMNYRMRRFNKYLFRVLRD